MARLLPNVYLLALGVSLFTYLIIWGAKALFSTRIEHWIKKPKNSWDEIVAGTVERTSHFFILITSLYIGSQLIRQSRLLKSWTWRIFFIVLMWQIALWSFHALDKWISETLKVRTRKNPAAASSVSLIKLFFRFVLFSIILLFTLSHLGIKVTTIVAGLGVGGIAVALALQKILGDLFSSMSIIFDKPFVVGDFIVLEQYMGEVEKIGLKTTRLRSLSGEQIIISNSDLLATRIRNFKRMHERRVIFVLGLSLETSTENLRQAVSLITSIIHSKDHIRFDRSNFMKVGSTSLDIETVYWVLSDDYNLHMNIQEEILLEIRQAFKLEGIHFAYPVTELKFSGLPLPAKKDATNRDSLVS